jgi:hypothetical protein
MAKVGADPEQGACQIYGYESVGRAHVLYDDPGYPGACQAIAGQRHLRQ